MLANISHKGNSYKIDFSNPLDISISLRGDNKNPMAWYLKHPEIEPVVDGDFIGKVSKGSSVNFNNIWFNPHAHATHTECVGHISNEAHTIQKHLKTFFFKAKLISIEPQKKGEDLVFTKEQVRNKLKDFEGEALVLRTLPNYIGKISKNHSHSNWPYIEEDAMVLIREAGIKHFLTDQPSVDKEKDEGKLLAHKAFWDYPKNTRFDATITELIYVPNKIEDGEYFLSLQPASFENDAAPCKPVLYKIID
ncbi:cyclase family protein [Gramella lutea]|uniref:Cyclase family protein n=1 Tax=Christiangramia lutea TaxID=1607951 RepID=A0A9X1V0J2_9FLAO|nr:cyclase family protein [Christiangramia lutea]MCH4822062.1 cyclase family protein [Christiangramia lutea]